MILKSKIQYTQSPVKFGTDGWRGIIGRDYTFDNVRIVAQAVSKTFERKIKSGMVRPKIYIGYDHRFLAEKFAEEAARTLSQFDFKPRLLSGAVSSPFLSYITWKNKSPFGVMITASHNPAEYLGFKVKGSFGGSIAQETATEIEKNLKKVLSRGDFRSPSSVKMQSEMFIYDPEKEMNAYIDYLKKNIDISLFRKPRLSIIFDSLYGPGGKITQTFFDSVKNLLSVEIIHNRRDTLFGGLHPEPIEEYLNDLKDAVKKSKAAAGFALDGDADRLGVIDEKSRYLTPHQVFSLLLFYLAGEKKLKGKVVQAVSLGYISERIAQDFNLPFEEVPVGFKYVAQRILKEDVILGGEESGGYGLSRTRPGASGERVLPERDGLLSALLFLEMRIRTRKSISQLLAQLQKRYGNSCFLRKDIHLTRPVQDKADFVKKMENCFPSRWMGFKVKEMRTIDGLKVVMEDGSWILMRPSGTELLLRTYGEFPRHNLIENSLNKLARLVHDVIKQ